MLRTVDLSFPFRGRWLVQNSPAGRVPSHGTHAFATSYAIDFVPVDERGRSAPFTLRSLLRPAAPDRFPGFGREILAPTAGVVVAAHDGAPDHDAVRGAPSVRYALTQGRRAAQGWAALAGNHVVLEIDPEVYVALCHLRRGTVRVRAGQAVGEGDVLGRCGNSGNSTEPHVHVQAMTALDPRGAEPVPMTFDGGLPRNGQVIDRP